MHGFFKKTKFILIIQKMELNDESKENYCNLIAFGISMIEIKPVNSIVTIFGCHTYAYLIPNSISLISE